MKKILAKTISISKRLHRWSKTYPVVFIKSKKTIAELRRKNRRGLFLDCGSNLGQGFAFFSRFYTVEYFDFELFEPNPNCFKHLQSTIKRRNGNKIILHKKAVGIEEGVMEFFGTAEDEGGALAQGGSILKDHNSKFYEASSENMIQVKSMSLASFLCEKLEHYDTIVIKMDIEGGEYAVISDLIEKKLFDYINTIYVEFHSQYMVEPDCEIYRLKEDYFRSEISKSKCSLCVWY